MSETSTALRRELGLRDITLFAIACIVGTRWIAAAAHAGPGSVTLWICAALFFAVPMAAATGALTARHPKAGGLYVWTRADFGPWHGFLCFWVYWMGMAFWFPSAAMFYSAAALHAAGLPESRGWVLSVSLIAIWAALGSNLVGLRIGKWTQNIGGISAWLACALMAGMGALVWARRGPATPIHMASLIPEWNWGTVTFWAAIAYAMSGIEMAGLMGGEVRDPARTLPRAGWIASACVSVLYIAATLGLLALLPPSEVSEMTGLSQAGDEAGRLLGWGWTGPVMALLVTGSGMGQLGGIGTSISRLPFAAGADRLLPDVFSRVHPRWGTPYASILGLGVVATVLLAAIQLGDSMRSAYQAMVSLMVMVGFLPYLYIFGSAWKCGLRASALSGWSITILAILCALAPPADVASVWLFEAKLLAGTLAVMGSGWFVYRRNRRVAGRAYN